MKKIVILLAVIFAVGCHNDDSLDDPVNPEETDSKVADFLGEYQGIFVFNCFYDPVLPYRCDSFVKDSVLAVEKISGSSFRLLGLEVQVDKDGKFSYSPDLYITPEVTIQNDTLRAKIPVRRVHGIFDTETFIGIKNAKSPLKAGTVGFRSAASEKLEGEGSWYTPIDLELKDAKLGATIVIEILSNSAPVSLGEYADWPYSGFKLVANKIFLTVMPNSTSALLPLYCIDDQVLHANRKIQVRISDESVGITPSEKKDYTLTILDDDVAETSVNKIIYSNNGFVTDMNSDGSHMRYRAEFDGSSWPTFSPDGNRIVFVRKAEGGREEVYTMNFTGDDLKRLTNNDRTESYASYSPTGDKILFIALVDESPRTCQIFTMNTDGTGEIQLSHIDNGTAPLEIKSASWSPDGTQIAFTSSFGNDGFGYRNYIMNADGSNVRRLTNKYRSELHPRFSPDGQKIIFNVGSGLGENLYFMNADGTGEQKLFTDVPGLTVRDAEWSPDGMTIIFQGRIDLSDFSTFRSNIDGSNFGEMIRTQMDHASWSPAK